jgi:hypothetical protein
VRHSAGVFSLVGFGILGSWSLEGVETGGEEEGEPGTGDCAVTRAFFSPSLASFVVTFS